MSEKSAESPVVLRPARLRSFNRGGGARTTPLVTAKLGAKTFINGITEIGPGAAIPFHSHNCEESILLLEGRAVMDVDGESMELQPLDITWVPPNVVHRFRNLSQTVPMKILWTYASPGATRTLADTGATNLVMAEHDNEPE